MNPIFQAAWEFEKFSRARGWRFCFIGGLAVQRWGKPRFTADADLTLLTGFGGEAEFVDAILETFPGRISAAREFALQSRVLLVHASNDIPIDISLGAIPFEERTISRCSPWRIDESTVLTTCGAEDLIVQKCFADRPQDWLDVEGIVGRQDRRLDRNLIVAELTPLAVLKEKPEILERLKRLLSEAR